MDSKIEQLINEVKQYALTRYDLLRLEILEKLSLIIGLLVMVLICAFLVLIAFAYFSIAVAMWLANYMHISLAFCSIGAVFMLVMVLLIVMRKRLFLNPLINQLSTILFSNPEAKIAEAADETVNPDTTTEEQL